MSRSKKSIKNLIAAIVGQSFGLIISFLSRIIFIRFLGTKYLGLNGLFSNILSVLSLAELGIGEAITFSLYKPLSKKNIKECQMIMQFYRKVYTIIGIFVLIVGIGITPFLKYLISDKTGLNSINLIYILFVINSSISYFFSYKRNLIIADQNRYIATIYRYSFYFLLNIAQIAYLVIFKDYIGFLVIQILFTILENISVSRKADKMYLFLKNKKKIPLDKSTRKTIVKNTKAMLMHKIGGIIVSSTDNIILSTFVNLSAVGLYSNYYLIISALNTIFGQLFNSLTASVGNLFATESKEKCYFIFKNIFFLNFVVYSISSICLVNLFNPFIELWIGKKYFLSQNIVLILVVNFYITGMRKTVLTFKEAAGLFYNDRWKSVVEAIVNLIFSLILVKKMGIFGVFLGTFISSVTVCNWVEPYVLFKYGFKLKLSKYFKKYFQYSLFTVIVGGITYFLCSSIKFNLFFSFVIKTITCLVVPNIFFYCFYHKSEEFQYFCTKFLKKKNNL